MSDDSRALVPVCPRGVVASVGRRIEITEKIIARSLGKEEYTCPIMGAKFVLIPAGTFIMGSPSGESEREDDETQYRVTISHPFYMQTTPVTQGQWESVMKYNFSFQEGDNHPVEMVSWFDVQEFILKLNSMEKTDKYRLPTEAQWEYAARAGSQTRFHSGDRESDLSRVGWYQGNSGDHTHPVGEKEPNAWGLYDMHGNVWEWVQDRYGDYPSGSVTDPSGPSSGSERALRGGSWLCIDWLCRSARRFSDDPCSLYSEFGFRLLRMYSQDLAPIRGGMDQFPSNSPTSAHGLPAHQDAIEVYRQAVDFDPESSVAWYKLGGAYDSLMRYEDAVEAYHQSVLIDPEYAYAWFYLAYAYLQSGNLTAALDTVRELHRLNPKKANALYKVIVKRLYKQ